MSLTKFFVFNDASLHTTGHLFRLMFRRAVQAFSCAKIAKFNILTMPIDNKA